MHGLRKPREEIASTARPKIQSQSQIFRYGGSIFCLPHRPIFSDIFDLWLHWMFIVRGFMPLRWSHMLLQAEFWLKYLKNSNDICFGDKNGRLEKLDHNKDKMHQNEIEGAESNSCFMCELFLSEFCREADSSGILEELIKSSKASCFLQSEFFKNSQ